MFLLSKAGYNWPLWWSSGQRARLLIWRSKLKTRIYNAMAANFNVGTILIYIWCNMHRIKSEKWFAISNATTICRFQIVQIPLFTRKYFISEF